MNFNIHIVISNRSFSYLRFILRNYRELSSKSSNVNFKIYCLDRIAYARISKNKMMVDKFLVHNAQKGSVGHAMGLSLAVKNFTVGEINIISDADIGIVANNWDILLQEFLNESTLQID